MNSHQQLDQRSLALHRAVVDKIRHDPTLLVRARGTLLRWRQKNVGGRTQPYLDEWQQVLDADLESCLALAVEESEHAEALRQSSPLSCLLTPKERFAFLKEWQQAHAAP